MSAPAYFFHGMTFCESCAYRPTALGLIITGLGVPENMDDAIARMMLAQVSGGVEVEVPVAVSAPGVCDNCHKPYGNVAREDALTDLPREEAEDIL